MKALAARYFYWSSAPFSHLDMREVCGRTKISKAWLRDRDRVLLRWFRPKLTGRRLCSLLSSTYSVAAALTAVNVTFFMYSGTLIGSWRHHGLVPWDDDVDIAVDFNQRQLAYRTLMDLKPRFTLNVKQKIRWKLFHYTAQKIAHVSWRYPFVDITFFHQNATHIWDHDTWAFSKYIYPRDWVFPLIPRPFHGSAQLPAPRETKKCLLLTYRLDDCVIGDYNHQAERATPRRDRKRVSCNRLRPYLPFVQRRTLNDTGTGCHETLVQEGEVIGVYVSEKETC